MTKLSKHVTAHFFAMSFLAENGLFDLAHSINVLIGYRDKGELTNVEMKYLIEHAITLDAGEDEE